MRPKSKELKVYRVLGYQNHSIDIRAFVYWYVALIDIEVLSFRVLGRGICELRDDWPSLVETYARTCSLF